MAITDGLIETLGGGGTVGLAVAAAVLVPTVYPPARRGLRGLAKAAIVQYLRVTEPRATESPAAEAAATDAATPARRGRPRAVGTGGATEAPAPRAVGAEPAAARAAAPARESRPRREQQAPAAAEPAPRRAPRSRAQTPTPAAAAPTVAPKPSPARREQPVAARTPQPAPAEDRPARDEQRTVAPAAPEAAPERRRGRPRANAEGVTPDGRVNLNVATRAQLTRLPRIGAQTADRIIQFREQEGPIRNLRQLRQADIITVAAARQMRDQVRF